ncbi:MAG: repeat-associated core domain protein, partial [Lacunisphaera sp.]|nr:repeat-associated core domain protein [Lacunisphaera sp.]
MLGLTLPVIALAVDLYWTSNPASSPSGQGYYIESQASTSGGSIDHYLYKNGTYVGYSSGYNWSLLGTNQTDYGAQTVEFRAEAYDTWDTYDQIYHYISITQSDEPPFGAFDYADGSVSAGQNFSGNGWAADNEMGAPVSRVDILIDGSDVGDASLGDNRPDVSSAYGRGDFQYSGWHFSYNTGGLSVGSHVVEMVARDNAGNATSLGSKSFSVAANSAPTNVLLSPGSASIYINTTLQISAHATDADGDITWHNLDIQRPDGSWNFQGGFASGEPFAGGPVGSGADSTRTAYFTFDQNGYWHVRSWASDANGNNLHTNTVEIYVSTPNVAPTIGWNSPPSYYPNSGANFTVQATGNDQDGNLSQVAVDISINGGAWTPFAYNGGGNGSANTSDGNLVTAGSEGTTYQFRAIAGDSAGAYSLYTYTPVFAVNRTPAVSMQILDASLAAFPIGGNGRAQVPINTNYYIRVSGTDPDGRLSLLYERHIPVGG